MKNKIEEVLTIQKSAEELGGIITLPDVKALLYDKSLSRISRLLTEMETSGVLKRFIRGFYYLPDKDIDLALLSRRIAPKSYISFETVLAKKLIIGTMPEFAVSAIKIGACRIYQDEKYKIAQYGIKSELFFGYELKGCAAYADKEKAVLDILYCYSLGNYKPLIDIYSDIDYSRFEKKKMSSYLKKYGNPKFRAFVDSLMKG